MKFGYNIDSSQNHVPLHEIALVNAPYHLLMTAPPGGVNDSNALNQMARYKDAIPTAQWVWRTYNAHEGNWTLYPSPETIVARWKAEGHKDVIRDDPCNEPNIGNDTAYVARSVQLLDLAADAGFRVAIGAFSVGTPHHDAIQRGVYDPLLQAIARGNHFLSYHSYGHGIPDVGELRPLEVLADPQRAFMTMVNKRWDIRQGYWYLRRSDWFVMRARELGLPDTPTIFTEACFDQINVNPAFMDQMRRSYGLSQYNHDLRGVTSWAKYWEHADAALIDIMEYLRDNVYYPDYIKGVCLFAINQQWRYPQGHDWGVLPTSLIADVNNRRMTPQPEQPKPEPSKQVVWTNQVVSPIRGAVNIRRGANAESDIIGRIPERVTIEVGNRTVDSANYTWQLIRYDGITGYVAREVLRWHGSPLAEKIAQVRKLLDEIEAEL